jgi:hypothetical protein
MLLLEFRSPNVVGRNDPASRPGIGEDDVEGSALGLHRRVEPVEVGLKDLFTRLPAAMITQIREFKVSLLKGAFCSIIIGFDDVKQLC